MEYLLYNKYKKNKSHNKYKVYKMNYGSLTEAALKARREYYRAYNATHREQINEKHTEWQHKHPEKVREYRRNYWEKKAAAINNTQRK